MVLAKQMVLMNFHSEEGDFSDWYLVATVTDTLLALSWDTGRRLFGS